MRQNFISNGIVIITLFIYSFNINAQNKSQAKTSTFSNYYDRTTSFEVPAYPVSTTANYYYLSSVGAAGLIGVEYDNSSTIQIDEFLVLFAAKVQKTGNRIYKAYLYNADANGLPSGSPLDSTIYNFSSVNAPLNPDSSALATINSAYNFTSISFSSPVTVAGDFVAVVEIDDTVSGNNGNDIVYLYTNNCNGDGNGEDRMCHYPVPNLQKLTGGSVPMKWYTATNFWPTLYSLFNKIFDCEAIIIPIVYGEVHTLSTNAVLGKVNGLNFLGHYPNPAMEQIKIMYELENKNSAVNLKIFDITGKTVYETNSIDPQVGKHYFDIDIRQFSSGNLYYTITTENSKITSRFTVIK